MLMNRRALLFALAPGTFLLAAVIAAGSLGYRINTTPSMPLGIWKNATGIHRGVFVSACLTSDMPTVRTAFEREYLPHGGCPTGFAPMLKEVTAVAGDIVTLTDDGVSVNGQPLAHTVTRKTDNKGRAMPAIPRGEYTVRSGEYWLFASSHPNSYDSRYFGPVKAGTILNVMVPVATVAYSS